jgi:starch-binding outer membrane protein, SusD/RagB family
MKLEHSPYTRILSLIMPFLLLITCGCRKLVDIEPPVTSISDQNVFETDNTAISVLTGLYSRISQTGLTGTSGLAFISKKAGLSADELSLWSGANVNDVAYYSNSLAQNEPNSVSAITAAGHEVWTNCYSYIFTCNSAIQGLFDSNTLTPSIKQQLLGEARFIRAFLYFYLINFYGDVPLIVNTDYEENRLLPRTSKSEIYQFIIAELKEAETLLSPSYLNGQLLQYSVLNMAERVRPSKWAATALLSRVYLYVGDYVNAETQSSILINYKSLFGLTPMNSTFLKASSGNNESIWQLQPVNTSGSNFWSTEDARLFVLTAAPAGFSLSKSVYLSSQLINAFEQGDNRKINWVGSYTDGSRVYYFPNKYKIANASSTLPTEYVNVFRLAEQYLIRAEARAQENKIDEAKVDLNEVRLRAKLPGTTANDKSSLLSAILRERQVELFTEWGHRWMDLKRTGQIDAVMGSVTPSKASGASWKSYQQWYPIPLTDIQRNPNLSQNDEY